MKLKKKSKMMIVLSIVASLLSGCGNNIPKRLSEFSCTKIYVFKNVKNVMGF
ncbi:hypothetical protein B4147_1805 [Bacillus wiedmannii]|uniref:Lipoprotein n=1 Tax=Bacillus wiedmannii TaxID=1890302 RepID=A0A0G8BZP9_9BACI|nr:hypothetical protein B4147_1805 [Bacillus wiedmannii]